MAESQRLGGKVRAVRKSHRLTQVRLAEQLGISPSYLNLIEHNRRPLTAQLLLKLVKLFDLDLATFASDDTDQVEHELMEVFGDELFDDQRLTRGDVEELVEHHPNVARSIRRLYDAWQSAQEQARTLAGEDGDPAVVGRRVLPSEEVSDLLQDHLNHFPDLELAAERVAAAAGFDPHRVEGALSRYLLEQQGIQVVLRPENQMNGALRRLDRSQRTLELAEVLHLPTRRFQLAHAIGLLTQSDTLDRLVAEAELQHPESARLARVALANYFAAAVLMPYEPFLQAALDTRYDVDLLGHRFQVSFEQVAHRLTSLRRPGREGVPFHLIRIDIAGNISKRFSASGIRFARYSGACPRWNVFRALLTPGAITTQVSRMPDGESFFCLARTLRKGDRGFRSSPVVHAVGLGCRVEHAEALVYADGIDLTSEERAVPIGVTCRLCERRDCDQRALPSIGQPLRVDEDVRGLSFYAEVDTSR